MANNSIFVSDLLIVEKLYSGRWLVEPSTGKIYSKDIGGYLKPHLASNYPTVRVGSAHVLVSRVIWIAVHGIPELDILEIDHINENKLDNRIENLRLLTRAGNARHSLAKLTYDEVQTIRKRYAKGGITQKALATEYKVGACTISKILTGEIYKEPKQIVDLEEPIKQKIFEDVCYKGNLIDTVMEKYNITSDELIATVEEQSLKVEISRRNRA